MLYFNAGAGWRYCPQHDKHFPGPGRCPDCKAAEDRIAEAQLDQEIDDMLSYEEAMKHVKTVWGAQLTRQEWCYAPTA